MGLPDESLQMYGGIRITDEMRQVASEQADKREPDIMHHFETDHYRQKETDMIGFYGEFGLRVLLGLGWEAGIRPDYKTINSHDVLYNGWSIDVKTESIPKPYIWKVLRRAIEDNEVYGRRLYHVGQRNLLAKYDILVMGAVVREERFEEIDAWFPIGWLPASRVASYPSGKKGPKRHSGKPIVYPFAAYQIATQDLRSLDELLGVVREPKAGR